MAIDYFEISEEYRPERIGKKINKLLVGEAPPPNGKSYFYVPRPMSNNISVHNDRSLPATIFYHYFKSRPETKEEYAKLLFKLQKRQRGTGRNSSKTSPPNTLPKSLAGKN